MNITKLSAFVLSIAALMRVGVLASAAPPEAPIIQLSGTDFKGGAADLFGSVHGGQWDINYVYAQPTGSRSNMTARFMLNRIPEGKLFLHVKGRDDDGQGKCDIAIEINGHVIFEGPNDFSETEWLTRRFPIPEGVLKPGENTVAVSSREKIGNVGNPPWFQLAMCAIAGETLVIIRDLAKDFWIDLPEQKRDLPEPLKPGQKPGFQFRGIKAWMWKPEQYLSEIPVLAKYKMNFFMNCYTNMCDLEHYPWGNPEVNRWWEDLPETKKKAYEQIVQECRKHDITFCFSMNPNLCSKRPLNYYLDKDIDDLWKHYKWMQDLGVKWFNISLDDISQGIDASGQARVVNEIFRRLKIKDPDAKMIFCPTIYWGDGTKADERKYLDILARELNTDVYLFWTGDSVVGNITRKAAERYRHITKHRLFIWDNYPVNDSRPTMHLGPLVNRDPDLCEVADGYMSNPLCPQNEGNRIPMLTCADYSYNPSAYDPLRSIGQAILHLEDTQEKRQILKDLVETYPGFVIFGKPNTGLNPVREQFSALITKPHSRHIAEAFLRSLEDLKKRMEAAFPGRYEAEKKTLGDDIAFAKNLMLARYPR